jgi:hypothetical protein
MEQGIAQTSHTAELPRSQLRTLPQRTVVHIRDHGNTRVDDE